VVTLEKALIPQFPLLLPLLLDAQLRKAGDRAKSSTLSNSFLPLSHCVGRGWGLMPSGRLHIGASSVPTSLEEGCHSSVEAGSFY
jgi:hypothetical protein